MITKPGYLLIDHRGSPGLTEDEARRAGMDPAQAKGGKIFEADTLTCSHCKTVAVKNTFRIRGRAICQKCGGHYICDVCHAKTYMPGYTHTPYDKVVDLALGGQNNTTPMLAAA